MSKNVLVIESSPRKKGNSVVLAAHAADALRQSGIMVETLHLHGMKIAPCNGCDGCVRQIVYCVQQDEMHTIYDKILSADGLILASPVYWFTYNAQLKICIDRWYGLWRNQPDFLKQKPVGVILTYGDVDVYSSGGINAIQTLESSLRYLNALIAGYVYGTAGEIGDAEKDAGFMDRAWSLGQKISELLVS